jgi:MarR-like DNA-binding transcriptional regulator SgrR of sgrS sRNA
MDHSYLAMRAHLFPNEKEQTVYFKQKELESIWFCTGKNVKRKLQNYQKEGLITYAPGIGRGHASKIQFFAPFYEEVIQFGEELIKKDQLEGVMALLQLPLPKHWITDLTKQIQSLFGFHVNKQRKDVLRSIVARPLTTLDPLDTSVTFESYLISQLSDTLVIYDKSEDCVKPHLAHHWEVSEDNREWTFYLRKGVKFHHLREMTSADVLHTINRFRQHPEAPFYWLVEDIQDMDAPTEYAIKINLKKENPFFLRYLATYNFAIQPEDVPFDEAQWVGTGPFRLKERTQQKLTLTAFEEYFLERPLLDDVEFWLVPPEAWPTISFQIEGQETPTEVNERKEIEGGFRLIGFNFHTNKVLHDHLFRKAFYHLIDIEAMFQDLGRIDLIPSSSYFHWLSKPQTKNAEAIKPLLQRSTYKGEALHLFSLNYPKAIEEAEWIVRVAEKYGIKLVPHQIGIEEIYEKNIEEKADLILFGEVASNDYQLSFLGAFYNKALTFRRLLSDEALHWIDAQLEDFKRAPTSKERLAYIEKIEDYLRENNLIIYLFHPIKRRTFHPMIRNIHFEAYGQIDLRRLWISG